MSTRNSKNTYIKTMKLIILLINMLRILAPDNNIKIQGSFFPSPNEQKFFKYYFTDYRHGEIEDLEDILITPFTSISIIALDTKELHAKQSEIVELDEFVSKICSNINWESEETQSSSQTKLWPSNQYQLGTLFTAGFHLELSQSKWKDSMLDFKSKNAALNKLKENLEIYFPKESIKAYNLDFKTYVYDLMFSGRLAKSSTGPQEKTFSGGLQLTFIIPNSDEFINDTKRGLLFALESLKNRRYQEPDKIRKATEIEARIRREDVRIIPILMLEFHRPIEIKKTVESSGKPSYNITFEEIDVNRLGKDQRQSNVSFKNSLGLEYEQSKKDNLDIFFHGVGLDRKNDIEKVNSLLDEYFENFRPDTSNPRPDTNKSRNKMRDLILALALFFCIAGEIFLVGYYHRKRIQKFLGRFYKPRQGRNILKLIK